MEQLGLLKFLVWMLFVLQGFLICDTIFWNAMDIRYWKCVIKKGNQCPDKEINFFLYSPEIEWKRRVNPIGMDPLSSLGWSLERKNVIIIHGFNGSEGRHPYSYLANAYRSRGDYNVFTVDWAPLAIFPCYLSAINNLKLVSQCTAQLYSRITNEGAMAKSITCVGHSLGAHVCGMVTNHLSEIQYKIVGLDPARPLVDEYGNRKFRLTRDDAHVVQAIHTNAGFLGETGLVGHTDFCVNGGTFQPGCKGNIIRTVRCSHFQSVCYFAASVRHRMNILAVPCSPECPKSSTNWGLTRARSSVVFGEETPEKARGMYCIKISSEEDCPFD